MLACLAVKTKTAIVNHDYVNERAAVVLQYKPRSTFSMLQRMLMLLAAQLINIHDVYGSGEQ